MTENMADDMVGKTADGDAGSVADGDASNLTDGDTTPDSGQSASGIPVNLRVILASASPRRRELLKSANVKFEVLIPSAKIDEHIDQDLLMDPVEAAKKLAEKKAGAAVQELLADNPTDSFFVIGADTIVVCDGEIFGKPRNLGDATRMLKALSGKTHEVITGVSLWMILSGASEDISVACRTFADISRVTFKSLSDGEIADYLRKGESFDKAGAYAIQGEGASLVDHYEGALDTIIGLPVSRLLEDFPELQARD